MSTRRAMQVKKYWLIQLLSILILQTFFSITFQLIVLLFQLKIISFSVVSLLLSSCPFISLSHIYCNIQFSSQRESEWPRLRGQLRGRGESRGQGRQEGQQQAEQEVKQENQEIIMRCYLCQPCTKHHCYWLEFNYTFPHVKHQSIA